MKSRLADPDTQEDAPWRFDAHTPERRRALELAYRVASSSCSVLILGPTGVGKEVLAEDIHRHSARAGCPFISINCAAISASLFESEFFGHMRGSFTGAVGDKPGLVELADGGVLFLDEIGELTVEAQAKLLRFLAKGTYWPLGATRERTADVRVIAATHRKIHEMLGTSFREDLFYRLSVVTIRIPPLKPDDICAIARSMAADLTPRYGTSLRPSEIESLSKCCGMREWPGGARELRNTIERFLVLQDPALSIEENWAEMFGPEEAEIESGVRPCPPNASVVKHLDTLLFLGIAQDSSDVRDLAQRTERTVQAVYGRLRKLGLGPQDVGSSPALLEALRRAQQSVQPSLPWIQSLLKR